MDLQQLREMIARDSGLRALRSLAERHLESDPGHDLAHALRVASWTLRLGKDQVSSREAIAAALLHDIVNVAKDDPARSSASERSAAFAREHLPAADFSAAAVERICDAIVDHSYSRGDVPRSALGCALQDADRLEALGALGILRTATCGAKMGARYVDDQDPWAEKRPLDDRRFTIDHFFAKLFRLVETMQTEAGRAEARQRTAFMEAFLRQLGSEIGAPR